MKANIVRGNGFRGILNYVFDPKKQVEIVGGFMIGETPSELLNEFAMTRSLKPDTKKPVWHCSLSLTEGENLTNEKWREIIEDFMVGMGFGDYTKYVAGKHEFIKYEHVHIIASRIGLDGKLWHGKHDVRKAIRVCQELEKKHGLTITPGLVYDINHRAGLSTGELQLAKSKKQLPVKLVLQKAIDIALRENPNTDAFVGSLFRMGIDVKPNIASTGKMNGFSFKYQHTLPLAGGKLRTAYTWANLQKRGLDYNIDRDSKLLMLMKERYNTKTPIPLGSFPEELIEYLDDLKAKFIEQSKIQESQELVVDDLKKAIIDEEQALIDAQEALVAAMDAE